MQPPGHKLTLRWSPGHKGTERNERADKEAKEAAKGRTSRAASLPKFLRRPLSVSVSCIRRNFKQHRGRQAAAQWKSSARARKTKDYTGDLPSRRHLELVKVLPRRHAGVLMQLRTGHIPLQS